MSKEFGAGIDLSLLQERVAAKEPDPGEIQERYLHMAMDPDTFAHMPWIDTVLQLRPKEAPVPIRVGTTPQGEYTSPEDLFRTYTTYVAKTSSGLFGVKKKLVPEFLESEGGMQRFRSVAVQSCAMHYPNPYGDLEPFTHRFSSFWNTWHLPFVQGVVPGATTEELQRMHVEQRIQLPSDTPSGLILPS